MSRLEATTTEKPGGSDRPASPRRSSPLIWMTVACVLLGTSGVARSWQDRRHEVESNIIEACPFPIKSLPTKFGPWKLIPGSETGLDPLTLRITGASEHFLGTFADEMTGVSLGVLILFGPAEPVMPHTPEVCYPSSGYALADEATDRVIKSEGGITSRFRSAVYSKAGGRATLREEVYYSFRLGGDWSPDSGSGRKFPRRNPGVFKVQVQRRVAPGERRDRDDPIEQFLSLLIPEIERRIRGAISTPVTRVDRESIRDAGIRANRQAWAVLGSPEGPLAGLRMDPAGRPMSRELARPRHSADQDRSAANQADEQEDWRQVEGQRRLDDPSDRIGPGDGIPVVRERHGVRSSSDRWIDHGRRSSARWTWTASNFTGSDVAKTLRPKNSVRGRSRTSTGGPVGVDDVRMIRGIFEKGFLRLNYSFETEGRVVNVVSGLKWQIKFELGMMLTEYDPMMQDYAKSQVSRENLLTARS